MHEYLDFLFIYYCDIILLNTLDDIIQSLLNISLIKKILIVISSKFILMKHFFLYKKIEINV